MNDYMKALHQRFYQDPEDTEEEQEMDQAEQALKDTLDREQRRLLLALVNAQSLWQGRGSPGGFPPPAPPADASWVSPEASSWTSCVFCSSAA